MLLDMLLRARAEGARLRARHPRASSPRPTRYWREVEERYGITVEVYEGPSLPRQLAAIHGEALWETKPDLCCAIRKLAPLDACARSTSTAGSPALRRDQSPTRADAPKLGWDGAHELWKANPLADWDDERCCAYIRERGLPYNALHDQGYASIGCTHCTLPGAGREGRWAGIDKTECGLHVEEPA